VCVCVHVRVFV